MIGTKIKLNELYGGCSSFSWETEDNNHLWGRNFDFNRIAADSKITYLPRNTEYYTMGNIFENNLRETDKVTSKYAAIGTGSIVLKSTPTLFEGINEKGLMGGQLYFRKFAKYPEVEKANTIPLQPAFVVTYLLTQCQSVEEIIDTLNHKVSIVAQAMMGVIPTVHWIFSDSSGETIIIEPEEETIRIYRNSMGVLTNSPSYSWHCENLLNYPHIRKKDYDNIKINGVELEQCFSGTGALGLPGDSSSTSRFVRLSYLKEYGKKGKNEEDGVTYMFRLFQNIAFPLGMVEVADVDNITEHDVNVSAYDYTLYTSIMCAESLKFYWTVYENSQIQCIDLSKLMNENKILQYDMYSGKNIQYLN